MPPTVKERPDRSLTRKDIVDTTGVERVEEIEDLEVLFLSCSEPGGLDDCSGLRRLCMIDNGLKYIRNLAPVGYTLVSLTLCDQSIEVMENLQLPNLKDLFLHRNKIKAIGGLMGCQRLKRLWLSQNCISKIEGLHAVPELEELWLHANNISSLDGIEAAQELANVGLAGNPISDLAELKLLSTLPNMVELTLSDVHYGRVPLTDNDGYKEYIINHLPMVQILDGVLVTGESRTMAEQELQKAIQRYQDALDGIEAGFRGELQALAARHRQKEGHCAMLEREMITSLKDLQGLVENARSSVRSQSEKQLAVLEANMKSVLSEIEAASRSAQAQILAESRANVADFDVSESAFLMLERLLEAEQATFVALCHTNVASNDTLDDNYDDDDFEGEGTVSKRGRVPFHMISDNAPEFQWFSNLVVEKGGEAEISVVRAFRLSPPPPGPLRGEHFDWASDIGGRRIYCVMTPQELSAALQGKWSMMPSQDQQLRSRVFSTSAHAICMLQSAVCESFPPSSSSSSFSPDDGDGDADISGLLRSFDDVNASLERSKGGVGSARRGSKHSSSGFSAGVSLQRLESARTAKVLLLVACRADTNRVNITLLQNDEGNIASSISLPVNTAARAKIYDELSASKRAIAVPLDTPQENSLIVLPPDDASVSLWPEFASIVVTPLPDMAIPGGASGGLNLVRVLEGRVEALSFPAASKGPSGGPTLPRTTQALGVFEDAACDILHNYASQLMEESMPDQASWLKDVESGMRKREEQTRLARDQIEHERRAQEAILKDMRGTQQTTLARAGSHGELPRRQTNASSKSSGSRR